MDRTGKISIIAAAVVLCAVVLYTGVRGVLGVPLYPYEDGKLYVHVMDVGQGDSILIRAPTGTTMLIDGGPDTNILEPIGRIIGLGKHRIDLMALSHPHADHVAGLIPIMERFDVGKIWYTGNVHTTPTFRAWHQFAQQKNIPMEIPTYGRHAWGGMVIDVLFPDKDRSRKADWLEGNNGLNDTSLVIKITFGETSFLFPGDAETALENFLVEHANLEADVLKVGHQGSRTSTQQSFLDKVNPAYAVISVGHNDYGHPHNQVIRRLNKKGVQLHRTDYHGTITYVSDGSTIEVYTDR